MKLPDIFANHPVAAMIVIVLTALATSGAWFAATLPNGTTITGGVGKAPAASESAEPAPEPAVPSPEPDAPAEQPESAP